jgi:transcription antitermination factor NusG
MYPLKETPEISTVTATQPWHALSLRHQHEIIAARYLFLCGHNVFLPLYSAVHRWQDRNKQLRIPLFPGYLFIQGGLERKTQILNAPGVSRLIGWSGRPAVIPQEQIDSVRNLVDSSLPVEPHNYLRCGERVRIHDGALQGVEGILIRIKNSLRLVVSVDLLGRSASIEVDSKSIEPVHHSVPGRCGKSASEPILPMLDRKAVTVQ